MAKGFYKGSNVGHSGHHKPSMPNHQSEFGKVAKHGSAHQAAHAKQGGHYGNVSENMPQKVSGTEHGGVIHPQLVNTYASHGDGVFYKGMSQYHPGHHAHNIPHHMGA